MMLESAKGTVVELKAICFLKVGRFSGSVVGHSIILLPKKESVGPNSLGTSETAISFESKNGQKFRSLTLSM